MLLTVCCCWDHCVDVGFEYRNQETKLSTAESIFASMTIIPMVCLSFLFTLSFVAICTGYVAHCSITVRFLLFNFFLSSF